ncbi:aminopeptidase YpdF [Cutibacterium acnes JCM 18918]|nr:aminopeptidase YpdF [Cutibacterium acnes JCM 18918]
MWPADIAQAAIDRAHELGARVTAHCFFSEEAPAQLVDAGIDCIEHGTGLTDETIATMAEREVGLVPTLINIETFPSIAAQADGKFPKYAAHMRHLHTHRHETIAKLGMPECRFMPVPTLAALSSTASLPPRFGCWLP